MDFRSSHLDELRRRLADFPVVALLGPRQVGKTTLARQLAESWGGPATLFDLEDPDHLARLSETGDIIVLVAALDVVLQRLHLALGARYHNPRERELAVGVLKREWAIRKLPGVTEVDTSELSEEAMIDEIAARWRALSGVIDWRA